MEKRYDKYFCVLDEPDSDYKLTINNISKEAIVIKADKFPEPTNIFSNSKMECKRADYIIVTKVPEKYVLYLELKRSNNSAQAKEVNAQLLGANCLMEYCKAIGKAFWKDNDFLMGYESRYIKFVAQTLNKRSTRITKNSLNNTPETALKVKNCLSIPFKRLLS